jgi:DNA-binding HxlR family transcriptional regulator
MLKPETISRRIKELQQQRYLAKEAYHKVDNDLEMEITAIQQRCNHILKTIKFIDAEYTYCAICGDCEVHCG